MFIQRWLIAISLTVLIPSTVAAAGAVAQQGPTPIPLSIPPGPVTRFPSRFDVVNAPEHFRQVLMIVDFPAGTWTPLHAPGGHVYTTVIDGEISTRSVGAPGEEATVF
jgi:hypothetical protein